MLKNLHIENIAVIKNADIDFFEGFTAFTGETGAGKSVVVDCLSLIAGEKVTRDFLRYGEDEGNVEAYFDECQDALVSLLKDNGIDASDGVIIRYNITKDGKYSVRICGRGVTKTFAKQVGKMLISVCTQDAGRELYNTESYIPLLDAFIGSYPEYDEYRRVYSEICENKQKLDKILISDSAMARERDMLTYQIKDIESKKLKIGEEEKLIEERKKLLGAEKINKQISFAYKALKGAEKGNVTYLLSRAAHALSSLADILPEMSEYSEKLLSYSYEIDDIAEKSLENLEGLDSDVTELIDKVEGRLASISSLKKRYGDSIEDILKYKDEAKARLFEFENFESLAEEYKENIRKLQNEAEKLALTISEKRINAAKIASKKVKEVLLFLDMPSVNFKISVVEDKELNPYGKDRVQFLIATNPGEELLPMDKIVSGGEMSRITLALRSVMDKKDNISCSVYDEIDTGISGSTSRKIGIKLKELSKNSQIISVTHSAQIATLANNHYLIKKQEIDGRANTKVKLLSYDERVDEASRILGGINITSAQIEAAKDMLSAENTGI